MLALAVLFAAQLSGCAKVSRTGSTPAPTAPMELDISAATTLRAALVKLAPGFEKANNAKLVYNFGASGVLQKQIESGAPCDVFASASPKQVDALISAGLVSADATVTFASNDIVIVVPIGNPAGIVTPADLAKATKLVTGNPDTAPHGTKAKEFLEAQGTWATLESKLIFAENAAQALDYVSRGEVNAGFVFASEALGNDTVEIVYTVPEGAVKPIRYVAAPVKASANAALAEKLVAYLLTPDAQAVLVENGFKPAPTAVPTPVP
jgi:molybdate transport system substrate-binding protein